MDCAKFGFTAFAVFQFASGAGAEIGFKIRGRHKRQKIIRERADIAVPIHHNVRVRAATNQCFAEEALNAGFYRAV